MTGRGQSRGAWLPEGVTGTVASVLLLLWMQPVLFPALGHDLVLSGKALVAGVFTGLSLLRGYGVRRLFNALRDRRP